MTRAVLTLGLAAGLATPGAAQWLGEPVWNSPTGGGLAVSADYAKPNDNYGNGTAWGARVSWGLRTITVTLGAASWTPGDQGESLTSLGANLAFRLAGGPLLPTPSQGIWANLQVGVAHTDVANLVVSPPGETVVTGSVGIGTRIPAPTFSVEPYFSPGIRYRSLSDGSSRTELGYAIGANVSFGLLGVHVAYDSENVPGVGNGAVFGVGAYVTP
jgi:hypothetical protein